MDEYIGIVKIFAGNFAPRGWMLCQGQILSIAQNTALFSLIGTTYGGNGQTTFALPNLCGMAPLGTGTSPKSGNTYYEGQIGGTEKVTLLASNLPPHNHTAKLSVSTANATAAVAKNTSVIATPGSMAGRQFNSTFGFADATPDVSLSDASVSVGIAGGGQPVEIMQPYLAMNYIICVEGVFPSRP